MNKFNEGEAKTLKDLIFNLSEKVTKQALWGILTILTFKGTVNRNQVKEILDDAKKYSQN